jgi:hypothetical protein
MLNQPANTKYTAILPEDCLNELRSMAERKVIPSINQGIRAAVEDFVRAQKEIEFWRDIENAASDPSFMKRLNDTMGDFKYVDAEGLGEW